MAEWVKVSDVMKQITEFGDFINDNVGPQEWFDMMTEKLRERQTPAIIRSIEENGFNKPIILRDLYGPWTLANGHHRLAIAILLGLDEILVDYNTPFGYSDKGFYDMQAAVQKGDSDEADFISDFVKNSEVGHADEKELVTV